MQDIQNAALSKKMGGNTANLTLYAAGKTISVLGTAIYDFAMGLYVLKLTGSAFSFALSLLLSILPMVVINPFAGALADKINKKTIAVLTELASGALLLVLLLVCRNAPLTLPMIYGTTFLLTVFSTFFGMAVEAAKPNMVSAAKLMAINSISQMIDSGSAILGPMLGGIAFAFMNIRLFVLVNSLSFVLSGLALLLMDFRLNRDGMKEVGRERSIHLFRDIREGFCYLGERPGLKRLFIILIEINFFLGFAVTIPLPYILNTVLRLGPEKFGAVQTAFPAGMILGAVIVKRVIAKIRYTALLTALNAVMGALMVLIGLPAMRAGLQAFMITGYYGAVMVMFGVVVAFIDIPLLYLLQKEIPDEYRGRVLGIGISIGKIMLPLAMVASGFLLGRVPSYAVPVGGGVLLLLITAGSAVQQRRSNLG